MSKRISIANVDLERPLNLQEAQATHGAGIWDGLRSFMENAAMSNDPNQANAALEYLMLWENGIQ